MVTVSCSQRANTYTENCSSPNVTCLGEMRSLLYSPLPAYMADEFVDQTIFLAFGSQPLLNRHYYSLLHYTPNNGELLYSLLHYSPDNGKLLCSVLHYTSDNGELLQLTALHPRQRQVTIQLTALHPRQR